MAWTPGVAVAALLLAALAGCADHPAAPVYVTTATQTASAPLAANATSAPPPGQPRTESGNLTVYAQADVVACSQQNEVLIGRNMDKVELDKQPGDTSLSIHLEWDAVNPTAANLRLRIVDDWGNPGGPSHADQWGPSPQDLVLFQRDLAKLNATEFLQVAVDGCGPEQAVAVHVVPEEDPQPISYRIEWNTKSDQ